MANRLEFSAKTVDLAIQEACRELNTTKDALAHEVVSYGSSVIFGLVGLKKARIRVSLTPEPTAGEEAESGQAGEKGALQTAAPVVRESEAKGEDRETDVTEAHRACRDALERIARAIDPTARIQEETRGSILHCSVNGNDSALLIGKHGQTLEAIQYLIDKIGSRSAGRRVAVEVDVEGYAHKRRKQLKDIAHKQAEKARRTGKPTSLGYMSASDRRIVHLALKQDRSVRTQSTGDGPVRKLMVIPRSSRTQKR